MSKSKVMQLHEREYEIMHEMEDVNINTSRQMRDLQVSYQRYLHNCAVSGERKHVLVASDLFDYDGAVEAIKKINHESMYALEIELQSVREQIVHLTPRTKLVQNGSITIEVFEDES